MKKKVLQKSRSVDPMPIFEKMFKKRMKAYKALEHEETLYTGHP